MSSIQSQGRQTVTAFFDSKVDADHAASRIRDEGLAASDVRVVAGDSQDGGVEPRHEHKGFWAALGDFFLPNEDRYAYAEGLSRGGFLVSVATTEANRSRVIDILDDEGTVDFDAREASWRSEGWQGYRAEDNGVAPRNLERSPEESGRTLGDAGFNTAGAASAAAATGIDAGALSGTTPYDRRDEVSRDGGTAGDDRFRQRDASLSRSRVRAYRSDDLGGNVLGGERLGGLAEQVDRTDVEMEDRREEGLLDRDELARRNAGTGSRSV